MLHPRHRSKGKRPPVFLLAPRSLMGTVPPCLPLDLVSAFLSVSPPGYSMKPCLTSIPRFLSPSKLFAPNSPSPTFFSSCILSPRIPALPAGQFLCLDLLLSACPRQYCDEALQERSGKVAFLQAGKTRSPAAVCKETVPFGVQEVG